MTMPEFVQMLIACRDHVPCSLSYRLLKDNKLNNIINVLGGEAAAVEYFQEVEYAEPATIGNDDKEKI